MYTWNLRFLFEIIGVCNSWLFFVTVQRPTLHRLTYNMGDVGWKLERYLYLLLAIPFFLLLSYITS